jgi:serine/threonine protein kinase
LIDLDAVCNIGVDTVGFKSSSGYVPPEAVYINESHTKAVVRSETTKSELGEGCSLVVAHPSFDIWSLGVILYQLCHSEVIPLFQCGQDDNLTDDKNREDNLYILSQWSDEMKIKKLSQITNMEARNLISQMLMKDPSRRPTIERILAHPFISKKQVGRLVGDNPEYDVFISYRNKSDIEHAKMLYRLLTEKGLKVWWDQKCLKAGESWLQGFCGELV